MRDWQLRRRLAREAARLIYTREEDQFVRAKFKAARRVLRAAPMPGQLPSNREIRHRIRGLAREDEGRRRAELLRQMRIEALRMMRLLGSLRPRLVGGAWTGDVRPGSAIRLHVFCDSVAVLTGLLEHEGLAYSIRRHRRAAGDSPPDPSALAVVMVRARWSVELLVLPSRSAEPVLPPLPTGEAPQEAGLDEVEALVAGQPQGEPVEPIAPPGLAALTDDRRLDRFHVYRLLLLPLEHVRENRQSHPEGDALYHSLQVFNLARDHAPYDEEFLLAALLHDVGKAIDPRDHVAAALEALEGWITPRTAWLIEHHAEARALAAGTLGARARRRLEASEDFDGLVLLARCDRDGRRVGVAAPDVDGALDYLRELSDACGE